MRYDFMHLKSRHFRSSDSSKCGAVRYNSISMEGVRMLSDSQNAKELLWSILVEQSAGCGVVDTATCYQRQQSFSDLKSNSF